MARNTRNAFALRDHSPEGAWESNDGRYRAYAHSILAEHEEVCSKILDEWPGKSDGPLKHPAHHPHIQSLSKRRAQTSDTVRIYAAMAVEGYLNFYGVLRLGQHVFDEHFERLGLVPKVRALLLVCDQLDVDRSDELVTLLDRIAHSRNSLVHPKTREVTGSLATHRPTSVRMPEAAQEAVKTMEAFFAAFVRAVPQAAGHLNRLADA